MLQKLDDDQTLIWSKTASTATGSTAAMREPKRKVSRRPRSSSRPYSPVLPMSHSVIPGGDLRAL